MRAHAALDRALQARWIRRESYGVSRGTTPSCMVADAQPWGGVAA
eukprot:CAMPEP_0181175848 /NCGR_PEP_ID=MMETSP1096-20121128/4303_1 /TAXON_ID=156174 ORGANISM="Chrysochromulina ericina, Strain CCMP281" /NCGR_SAMPLE_ID=MMETSP1096 /ASSEMBLY_ACC=CAM_ASM_000453 /LENGTH=44 /DNA_ID= /DNA_START= /DNA_END= /DNA_ORIENTATION=